MIWVLILGLFAIFAVSIWLSSKDKEHSSDNKTPRVQEERQDVVDRVYDRLPIPNQRISQEYSHDTEPFYQDTPLSSWLELLNETQLNPNKRDSYEEAREAIREIGPQAVPFLMKEFEGDEVAWKRACAGFRALGELGESAVPDLFQLVEKLPGYAPGALASIGGPAVPYLQECLKSETLFGEFKHPLIPGNTMAEIHNSILSERIPASQYYPLFPAISELAKSDNTHAARYAKRLLKTLLFEMEMDDIQNE